jgi:hypothetical protein
VVLSLFLITIIDYIFGTKVVVSTVSGETPLAPISIAVGYLIIPIILNLSRQGRNRYSIKKQVVLNSRKIPYSRTVSFLVFCSMIFILTIFLIIVQI